MTKNNPYPEKALQTQNRVNAEDEQRRRQAAIDFAVAARGPRKPGIGRRIAFGAAATVGALGAGLVIGETTPLDNDRTFQPAQGNPRPEAEVPGPDSVVGPNGSGGSYDTDNDPEDNVGEVPSVDPAQLYIEGVTTAMNQPPTPEQLVARQGYQEIVDQSAQPQVPSQE